MPVTITEMIMNVVFHLFVEEHVHPRGHFHFHDYFRECTFSECHVWATPPPLGQNCSGPNASLVSGAVQAGSRID